MCLHFVPPVHRHLLKHKEKVVQTHFYNMKFNSFPRSRSGRSHATFPALTFLKAAKHDVIDKIMGEDMATTERTGKKILPNRATIKVNHTLTDTTITVPPRRLITTIAPASVACRVMVYAALSTTPIVIFTLITVDLFCATSTARISPVGRGWIVTVSFPGSDAT